MARELTWNTPTEGNPTIWAPSSEVYLTLEDKLTFFCTEANVPLSLEDQ